MRLLLILVVVAVGFSQPILIDDVIPPDPQVSVSFSMGDFLRGFVRPLLVIVVVGIAIGIAVATPHGRRAALAFLMGRPLDEVAAAHASRAFAATAKAMVVAGILLGFASTLVLLAGHFALKSTQNAPVDIAGSIFFGLQTTIVGLLLGRVVLGTLAEGTAARARAPRPAGHAFAADLALLVALAIPPLITLAITTTY